MAMDAVLATEPEPEPERDTILGKSNSSNSNTLRDRCRQSRIPCVVKQGVPAEG